MRVQVNITCQIDEALVRSKEMHVPVVIVVDGNPSEARKTSRGFLLLDELLEELSELLLLILEVTVPHLRLDPGVICVARVIVVAAEDRPARVTSSLRRVVSKEPFDKQRAVAGFRVEQSLEGVALEAEERGGRGGGDGDGALALAPRDQSELAEEVALFEAVRHLLLLALFRALDRAFSNDEAGITLVALLEHDVAQLELLLGHRVKQALHLALLE